MKFMAVAHMVPVSYSLFLSNYIKLILFFSIGTFANGDGSRKPTDLELNLAQHQGTHFSQTATALKIGRAALPPKDASTPDAKQK
jgi:hypothetical protein